MDRKHSARAVSVNGETNSRLETMNGERNEYPACASSADAVQPGQEFTPAAEATECCDQTTRGCDARPRVVDNPVDRLDSRGVQRDTPKDRQAGKDKKIRGRQENMMLEKHQWMPHTLFDMAAFCEKNGLEKAGALLLETAVMLYICLSRQEQGVEPDVNLRAESIGRPTTAAANVVPFSLVAQGRGS